MKLGLLGCGRIGQVHARSLSRMAGADLVAVADAMPAAAEALAASSRAEIRAPEAIIAGADIDAVIIATPTTLHYDQIHACAAAGKAIFCEKPIDLSAERAAECREAVAAAGVPFLTAFNRRFDPSFAHLQAQLRAGAIGNIEQVIITSRDPAPPPISYIESSGGLFRDMMVHDLDMARFLLGEEPVELYAVGSCLVDPEIGAAGDVDTAAVTLTTASGKICQITNSRRATYGYDQRIEVHGAEGMLQAANQPSHLVTRAGGDGFNSARTMDFFLERYEAAYLAEMTHFVEAVSSGAPLSATIEDGVAAQRLADSAARAMASGAPIRLTA
ncbi:inositol 2-dehydrogenase [Dinoroseobacter sp. S124A]|uniref:inositol 2-dehydrogenase n=1 Tax=Dinoroseobacter sp. S124A TaxID=3415128 RepID=UPI003C7EB559